MTEQQKYQEEQNINKKINWVNLRKAFIIALCVLIAQLVITFISSNFIPDKTLQDALQEGVLLIMTGIVAHIANKYKTGKYERCSHYFILAIFTYFFSVLGVWATAYQILQIKSGNVNIAQKK